MGNKNLNEDYVRELVAYLVRADDPQKMQKLLESLLSPSELNAIATRVQIFKQLKHGIPQREIAANLGVGIATVTRGSREMKAGRDLIFD